MECPHCRGVMFRKSADGGKLKARTKILVLHKSGGVEINCDHCGKGVLLPLQVDDAKPQGLRKADSPRLVARKG